jgi:uncharacterized protein with PQ loop repeat
MTKTIIITIFGYFKLIITMSKYWPQVMWNYKRKTTDGFSICGILMDFLGGIMALLQMSF